MPEATDDEISARSEDLEWEKSLSEAVMAVLRRRGVIIRPVGKDTFEILNPQKHQTTNN